MSLDGAWHGVRRATIGARESRPSGGPVEQWTHVGSDVEHVSPNALCAAIVRWEKAECNVIG